MKIRYEGRIFDTNYIESITDVVDTDITVGMQSCRVAQFYINLISGHILLIQENIDNKRLVIQLYNNITKYWIKGEELIQL